MTQKVAFPEAVRMLANKIGMAVPEGEGGTEDRVAAAERESLIKLHETALEFFKAQLASPAGARARRELEQRQLSLGISRVGQVLQREADFVESSLRMVESETRAALLLTGIMLADGSLLPRHAIEVESQ